MLRAKGDLLMASLRGVSLRYEDLKEGDDVCFQHPYNDRAEVRGRCTTRPYGDLVLTEVIIVYPTETEEWIGDLTVRSYGPFWLLQSGEDVWGGSWW